MADSYKSIFKTSMLTGGSQVMVMVMRMVRAKALAVLLGPSGTGIIGLFGSTTSLVNTLANIGLSGSAVRQIAKDNSSGDREAIGETLFVYRSLIMGTSLIAAIVMVIFAEPIGKATFGNHSYTNGIRWMALVVLFTGVSNGQYTLLQGLRRIKDLALAKVIGTLLGVITSILLIYFLGERGIIPFLIAGAITAILVSWWFAHKVNSPSIKVSFTEFKKISSHLLGMGLAFMTSGLVINFTGYYSRVLITDRFSVHELGLYTASWTLSAIYVNFILSAMGADFYPRLTAIIDDHKTANRIINEQTIMGLTLSTAGIVAVVGLGRWVLQLFYSAEFIPASNMLQWMAAGMAIKLISWPVGFILVSKGKSLLFTLTELLWAALYLPFLMLFTKLFDMEGAGIAFFMAYLTHTIVIIIFGYKITGFVWNRRALFHITVLILSICTVFVTSRSLPVPWQLAINITIIAGLSIYTYVALSKLLGLNVIKHFISKIKNRT